MATPRLREPLTRSQSAVSPCVDGACPNRRVDAVGCLMDEARVMRAFWDGSYIPPKGLPDRRVNGPQLHVLSNEVRGVSLGWVRTSWSGAAGCESRITCSCPVNETTKRSRNIESLSYGPLSFCLSLTNTGGNPRRSTL